MTNLCGTLIHPIGEIKSEEILEYMYFDTVREFFTSVKKIGAANSNKGYTHRNPSLIKELVRVYETNFQENNKIKVTYHCLYGAVKKSSRI